MRNIVEIIDKNAHLVFVLSIMKRFLLVAAIILYASAAHAQYVGTTEWNSEESFKRDEQYIINDIIWLEENPFATKENNTKAISDYVIRWLAETPYISVKLDEIFTGNIVHDKKYKYSDKVRVTYLFGKSLYALQHQAEPDEAAACLRGLEGVVKVYKEIIRVDQKGKHRDLEFFETLYDSGQLKDYVATQLKEGGSDL
jgi:hypothetical protein